MEQSKIIRWILPHICFFTCIGYSFGQDMPKEVRTREIIITYNDSIVRFNILLKASNVKAKTDLLYYWFSDEILHVNRGGYAGNLLQGKYLVFDRKMRLRTEGFYEQGLKTGIWKSWRESGELSSVIKWEDGQKNGKAQFFDNAGRLLKNCTYENDLLNGTMIVFHGKSKEKIKFRDGIEMKKPEIKGKAPAKMVKKGKITEKSGLAKDTTAGKSSNFFRKLFPKKNHPSGKPVNNTKLNKDNNTNLVHKDTTSLQKGPGFFGRIFKKKESTAPKKETGNKPNESKIENGSKEKEPKVIKKN